MSFEKFIVKSVKLRPKFEEELLVVHLPWKEQFDILIGGDIPDFIKEIYSKCNGTDKDEKITENYFFIPDYRLMKIQEVLKLHGEFVKNFSITKDLIPVFASSNNEYICYRYNDGKSDLVHFSNGSITTMYDSVTSFWDTIIKGYDQNIYGIDFKKSLSAESSKVSEIAKELNPIADFWK